MADKSKPPEENPEQRDENVDWGKMPQSLLGWVLYHFSPKGRKIIIGIAAVVIIAVLALSYFLLFFRENLAIRKMIKDEQLKYWMRSDDPAWKSALLNIWNKPGDVPQEIWDKASKEKDPQVLIAAAGHPWVLNDLKEKLTTEGTDVRVRIAGILNRGKKKEAIALLAKDEDEMVRFVVASSSETPPHILSELAKDSWRVCSAVASNPKTLKDTLRMISEKNAGDERILSCVASNPNTPIDILGGFASHKDGTIRSRVGANQSTPPEILKKLADDEYDEVRNAVASNPKTPPEILEKWIKTGNLTIKSRVASNPEIRPDILKKWMKAEDLNIKSGVASNRNISPDMLSELVKDPDPNVLYEVALNPKTEPKILKFLSKNENKEIQSAVASNPNTPQKILREFAKNEDINILAKVAANSSTPEEILEILARHSLPRVVQAVAVNSSTPAKILRRLAINSNDQVRIKALLTIISQSKDKWRQ